ncbi:uncharacterized protein LOC106058053 isoform X1 [Biomphalaria glabrata]|uniref:Uncharacterized protein LOC106058053 isoform X1 n=2 Tax=Biomphalaria glabrata TaxID=6526 RepID=A0A9W3A9S0_BIOGL|nr:uncharacterized protein LOC106058053 isoform X1 [Biomphalaria glabrata]XP_055883913.1 uncharacterized protein LOC106058053 isoform X1 [Biomphalaria glabrata]KAI8730970.1 CAunnamed protein product [Biomphalaria glabrata]
MRVRCWHLHAILTITVALIWISSFCAEAAIFGSMTDESLCKKSSEEIIWISEKTSAIISGKSKDELKNCQLRFGVASADRSARIQLKFEFLYIEDCLIQLQINESSTGDFKTSQDNREILKTNCYAHTPGPLYAQPKNFVLVNLLKQDMSTDAANFYLNVSMAGVPPTTGLELHILLIIGFVAVIVVIIVGYLLYKFVSRLFERIHEQRVQAAMTRAINIFHSQEPLEERQDMVLLRPGEGHLASQNPRAASIAFVHSDGRIERFRSLPKEHPEEVETRVALPSPSLKHSEQSRRGVRRSAENDYVACDVVSVAAHLKAAHKVSSPVLHPVPCRAQVSDFGDAVSIGGCEMPPSYEEALDMPGPSALLLSAHEDGAAAAVQSIDSSEKSQVDYMNVNFNPAPSESNDDLDCSDSGEALLARYVT